MRRLLSSHAGTPPPGGAARSSRRRSAAGGPACGTGSIRSELQFLRALLHFGQAHNVNGRALLGADPLTGVTIPQERNPMRPVATEERYQALLKVADAVEPLGRFRCVLALARETGRRLNAIVSLRASDVLLSREQKVTVLARAGQLVAWAEHWPHGALFWRPEHDKMGYESVAPLSSRARDALDVYLAKNPRAGGVPLFPELRDPDEPASRDIAEYWLREAEKKAKLPRLARGEYHAFRRQFATERRHLSPTDVMAAAGWRSLAVMRRSYEHTDGAGVYSATERPETPPNRERRDTERTQRNRKASGYTVLGSAYMPNRRLMSIINPRGG